jgi:hypothetical protein
VSIVGESLPFHGLLDSLADLVKDKKWSDWLFVFGTITVAANSNEYGESEILLMNFAPILKGGPGGRKMLAFKENLSTIDFLNCKDGTVKGEGKHRCVQAKKYAEIPDHAVATLNSKGFDIVEDNIFDLDGIRFGVEICKDHYRHELNKSLVEAHLHPDGVQVQLITAAGMNIQYSSVPAGGPVILQDGGGTDSNKSTKDKADSPPMSMVFPRWDLVNPDAPNHGRPATHSALGDNWREQLDGFFDVGRYDQWHAQPVLNLYPPMKIGPLNAHDWEIGREAKGAARRDVITSR